MKKSRLVSAVLIASLTLMGGCAYRYYLGMHGPSIHQYPEIHTEDIREDAQCLSCHGPDAGNEDAPVTSHPGFKGCFKCHSGPVK